MASVLQGLRLPGILPSVYDFSFFGNTRPIAVPNFRDAEYRFVSERGVPPGGRFSTIFLKEAYTHGNFRLLPPVVPATPGSLTPVPAAGASSLKTMIDSVVISRLKKHLLLPPSFSRTFSSGGRYDEHLLHCHMMCADLCAEIGEEERDLYDTPFWDEPRFYRPTEAAYETRDLRRIAATLRNYSPLRAQLKRWATALDTRQNGFFGNPERFQKLYLDPPSKNGHPCAVGLSPYQDPDRNVRCVPVLISLVFSLFLVSYGPQINMDNITFSIERPFSLDGIFALFNVRGFQSLFANVSMNDPVPISTTNTTGTPRRSFLRHLLDLKVHRPVQVFTVYFHPDEAKKLHVEVRVYFCHSSTHFSTHSPTP